MIFDIYQNSEATRLLNLQKGAELPVAALFSDIDNTLYHQSTKQSMGQVAELLRSHSWPLIAVTGLATESLLQRITGEIIPAPAVLACELGSTIAVLQSDGSYVLDTNYEGIIASKLVPQQQLLNQFAAIPESAKDNLNLVLQDDLAAQALNGKQVAKLGLFVTTDKPVAEVVLVMQQYFPGAEIIVSKHIPGVSEGLVEGKYCVDIAYVTKKTAVNYLIEQLGIEFGISAGDSGNDADMLFSSLVKLGIVVGGAEQEVVDFVMAQKPVSQTNLYSYQDKFLYLAPSTELATQGLLGGLSAATTLVTQKG